MQFKIRLVTKPGDQSIARAGVTKVNTQGVESLDQIVLEGETVETDVTLMEGEKVVIAALPQPMVEDKEQRAAVPMDLTPKDPLAKRAEPPGVAPKTPFDTGQQRPSTQGEQPVHPNAPPEPNKGPHPAQPGDIHGKDKDPKAGTVDMRNTVSSSKEEPKPHVPSKK